MDPEMLFRTLLACLEDTDSVRQVTGEKRPFCEAQRPLS